jgi:hypothetical protein
MAWIPGAGDLIKGFGKTILRVADDVPTGAITPPGGGGGGWTPGGGGWTPDGPDNPFQPITDPSRLLPAPHQPLLIPETASGTAIAYRAINPAYADSTAQSGQFFRSGAPGRLGNDGIYANSTIEGAIAEFKFHNPGVDPAVFKVAYPVSPTLNIDPPLGYFNQTLPFTQDANILTAPSLRLPGTVNLLIRQGAVPAGRVP